MLRNGHRIALTTLWDQSTSSGFRDHQLLRDGYSEPMIAVSTTGRQSIPSWICNHDLLADCGWLMSGHQRNRRLVVGCGCMGRAVSDGDIRWRRCNRVVRGRSSRWLLRTLIVCRLSFARTLRPWRKAGEVLRGAIGDEGFHPGYFVLPSTNEPQPLSEVLVVADAHATLQSREKLDLVGFVAEVHPGASLASTIAVRVGLDVVDVYAWEDLSEEPREMQSGVHLADLPDEQSTDSARVSDQVAATAAPECDVVGCAATFAEVQKGIRVAAYVRSSFNGRRVEAEEERTWLQHRAICVGCGEQLATDASTAQDVGKRNVLHDIPRYADIVQQSVERQRSAWNHTLLRRGTSSLMLVETTNQNAAHVQESLEAGLER